jgi:hypothetical protein
VKLSVAAGIVMTPSTNDRKSGLLVESSCMISFTNLEMQVGRATIPRRIHECLQQGLAETATLIPAPNREKQQLCNTGNRSTQASMSHTPGIGSRPAHCDVVQASPKDGSKLSSITAIIALRSARLP